MKTIKVLDIETVGANDLEPGMILALGIVTDVRVEGGTVMADLVGGYVTTWVEGDEGWQVYGRLSSSALDALLEAEAERVEEA